MGCGLACCCIRSPSHARHNLLALASSSCSDQGPIQSMCNYAVGVSAIECNNTWNNREMHVQMDCAHQHWRASPWRELPVPALPCQHRRQPRSISPRPPSGGPLLVSPVRQTLPLVCIKGQTHGKSCIFRSTPAAQEVSCSCLFGHKGVCASSPWKGSCCWHCLNAEEVFCYF